MKNRLPDPGAPARERIGWIDLLRAIACFLVVFSHCCDPWKIQCKLPPKTKAILPP